MNMFLIYIVIIVTSGVEVKLNTSIPAFYDLQSCKEYVMKNQKSLLDSANSTFINKDVLEMGCVRMKNKDEIDFNPIYKMDKKV